VSWVCDILFVQANQQYLYVVAVKTKNFKIWFLVESHRRVTGHYATHKSCLPRSDEHLLCHILRLTRIFVQSETKVSSYVKAE